MAFHETGGDKLSSAPTGIPTDAPTARAHLAPLRSLHQVAIAVGAVSEPAALADLAIASARQLLAADSAGLTWWDPEAAHLRPSAGTDESGGRGKGLIPGEGACGTAFQLRRPVVIDDYPTWASRIPGASKAGISSAAAVPLLVRDRAMGTLAVYRGARVPFSPEDVEKLLVLAGLIAPALAAARLETSRNDIQAQLSLVLANAPLLVFGSDLNGVITMAEGHGLDLISLNSSFFVGRPLAEVYRENPELITAMEMALAGNRSRFEMTSKLSGRTWDMIVAPVLDGDGAVKAVTGIAIDLTERRQAAEAVRESEAKSRFLAAMSHELRTPLNSILGFAQLLQRQGVGDLNQRQERYLDHISSSGQHLLSLINDVLDLTKIQAGQVQITMEPVDVRIVVKEAIGRLYPLAEARSLKLSSRIPPGLAIAGDSRRLHQVLTNLLSNAIKFTGEGGSVKVTARGESGRVEIRVSDSGIGIDSIHHQRIFEDFTQVESGPTRSHQGTGLGLPVSKRLVEIMGGTLSLESQRGHGSIFTINLPGVVI